MTPARLIETPLAATSQASGPPKARTVAVALGAALPPGALLLNIRSTLSNTPGRSHQRPHRRALRRTTADALGGACCMVLVPTNGFGCPLPNAAAPPNEGPVRRGQQARRGSDGYVVFKRPSGTT